MVLSYCGRGGEGRGRGTELNRQREAGEGIQHSALSVWCTIIAQSPSLCGRWREEWREKGGRRVSRVPENKGKGDG